jgi:hypothetical protein
MQQNPYPYLRRVCINGMVCRIYIPNVSNVVTGVSTPFASYD